ncbi:UNVERIFIED_CONTAM: hypothetical protein Scaly_0121500 [Sesamum calycinum]|uniref:Uncharacterized protein n=1 Tax=Sesamum calycinum TaxID=2727403 RepID=A0AAW2SYV5_9LAMI
MQTTSLQPLLLPPPFLGNFTTSPKRQPSPRKPTSSTTSPRAMKRDANREKDRHDHKLVDENMIVLKMRIQEIKRKEEELSQAVRTSNSSWMEWEKQWCKNEYESDVYEAVGFLQIMLMNTRPSLVLGLLALLMFTTSTSLALVLRSLLGIAM